MKYIVGLSALFLTCTCVWAAPETMTMYTTFSAPIASFSSVQTQTCDPVTMSEGQLNLGFVQVCQSGDTSCETNPVASSGGDIKLRGNQPFIITDLHMEKGTSLSVGGNAKWIVKELIIGQGGTASIGGALIANKLELKGDVATTLTVDSNLRLGSDLSVTNAVFTKIETGDCKSDQFCFDNTGTPPSSHSATWRKVACSTNESGCSANNYFLIGG